MIWIATGLGFKVGVFSGILAMGLFKMVAKQGNRNEQEP